MCISATVVDSTVQCECLFNDSSRLLMVPLDVLQSSGSQKLGWMAMYASSYFCGITLVQPLIISFLSRGFGKTMANSPMVIMWPNSDGSITLSQRMSSAEVMPTVVSSPPRLATLSTSLSSVGSDKIISITLFSLNSSAFWDTT
jgi:hypothetical protein